ncbi:hypothetical protein TRFO_33282 [Tritrichomonas foetus]|uniref:alpha-1,2-Mannosidase n=1 Tax=Tritrichomonas foetus TaxID=1144522 RepID=A0A1J4JSC8_9EUKA|nr:hypothetical protein TRFO_33282 [Tritrichomonas foetus]|eukprot:OHT00149.1 hypothetical protein TRFO_33282 [Tritrichomonas foetus]
MSFLIHMKKNQFFNRFRLRRILKNTTILLFLLLIGMIVFRYIKKDSQVDKIMSPSSFLHLTKLKFQINTSNPYTIKIRKAVSSAFDQYYHKCLGYDEFRPNTNECVNSFGFSSTIFDALDVLYLLDLKLQYQQAKKFIFSNFTCKKLRWVNRKEFWSRCIGSLISSYILTSDHLFLEKAIECSNEALVFDHHSSPFINIEQKTYRKQNWIKGISLSDIVAGLPELFALKTLTKNESYSIHYLSILNNIPPLENPLYNFFDISEKVTIKDLRKFDGNIVSFYQTLAIAQLLKPIKSIKEVLIQSFQNVTLQKNKESFFELYHLLPTYEVVTLLDQLNIPYENNLIDELLKAIENLYDDPYKIFEPESTDEVIPFRFDGSTLRSFMRNSTDIQEARTKILDIVSLSIDKCQVNEGFAGIMRSYTNELISTNIQHSNFFGQWISFAAYLLTNQYKIIPNAIFNDRGHILYSNNIFPDEDEE